MPNRYLDREIGKYKVIRLLGGGAFSWVYEAIDQDLEIPVALKVLRPEFAGQPEDEARFRKEAATAAKLRHPNIVTVRDVGRIDEISFVAMDLLPLSLARRLAHLPRLPETEVIRIGMDVAAALSIAHGSGIVHRDIKPDNILIGTHGEAVVADFGLARAFAQEGVSGHADLVTGTPHYFSPEQASGRDLDGRSDLYALGVTLFRAVTGQLPFPGEDWHVVARAHVEQPPPLAHETQRDVSVEFGMLLNRLLSKAPDHRFGTAVEVGEALSALSSAPVTRTMVSGTYHTAETVSALPPVTSSLRGRRSPLRLLAVVAGGTAGVVLVALVGWLTWQTPVVQQLWRGPTRTDSIALASGDSANRMGQPFATGVSGLGSNDSISADSALQGGSLPAPARPAVSAPRRTRLTIFAPDSAYIYVDNVRLGQGSVDVDRTGALSVLVRAVIANAPTDCLTAQRDSSVQLSAGDRRRVVLAVRSCIGLRISVTPLNARMRFTPLDGSAAFEVRADSATKSVLLPAGRYELEVSAPLCVTYSNDTIVANPSGPPLSRRIPLICG